MLVTLKEILDICEAKGCAVGSFNTPNLESIMAVIGAAEELKVPVIIQHAEVHEEIMPLEVIGPIMLELAKKALNESVNESPEQEEDVTPDKIMTAVCGYFKQSKNDIIGKGKKADLVKARQICAYLLCEMLSLPLVAVGNILGGCDHTTIMYARDKMEKLASLNDRVAKEIDDIKNIVLKK